MVEEMGRIYLDSLTEEERIDLKMADISLRDSLVNQIKQEIRCRKIAEAMSRLGRDHIYQMQVRIGKSELTYDLGSED
jgi:hypothetical protein